MSAARPLRRRSRPPGGAEVGPRAPLRAGECLPQASAPAGAMATRQVKEAA